MSIIKIQTVLKNINSEDLGYCHCHEHLFISNGQSAKINPLLRIDEIKLTVKELNDYKRAGGKSIVDAQPIGCGRMEKELIDASKLTGVNIIASTGFHKLMFYPSDHWIFKLGEQELKDIFISEIKSGLYINSDNEYPKERINNKAGLIKSALDSEGLTARYKKLFVAVAKAAVETGISIMCHTEAGKHSLELIEFLINQGVKKESIILCHLDRNSDNISYHKEVAKTGVYLEYDTIGRYKYHSDEKEVELIRNMICSGYEDRILLGLDTTRGRLKSYGGDIGLEYMTKLFIPLLKRNGISEKIINKFMIINPSRALTIKK